MLGGKGLIDFGATRKRRVIGDERLQRQIFQGDVFIFCQRMVKWHHQHVLPLVAGQGNQLGILADRFGGNADFGDFVNQHARHLIWRALMQADVDLGESFAQPGHGLRQDVTRLGVGGRDGQGAAVLR